MTATAEIVVREVEDALLVPSAALRYAPAAAAPTSDASGGNVLSRLMPRPPGRTSATTQRGAADSRVWVLREDVPAAVSIRAGASDGINTEVVEVIEGELDAGMAVIVDATEG
jgi:HlyD family secretion protein